MRWFSSSTIYLSHSPSALTIGAPISTLPPMTRTKKTNKLNVFFAHVLAEDKLWPHSLHVAALAVVIVGLAVHDMVHVYDDVMRAAMMVVFEERGMRRDLAGFPIFHSQTRRRMFKIILLLHSYASVALLQRLERAEKLNPALRRCTISSCFVG